MLSEMSIAEPLNRPDLTSAEPASGYPPLLRYGGISIAWNAAQNSCSRPTKGVNLDYEYANQDGRDAADRNQSGRTAEALKNCQRQMESPEAVSVHILG